jgi:hypothetical protein
MRIVGMREHAQRNPTMVFCWRSTRGLSLALTQENDFFLEEKTKPATVRKTSDLWQRQYNCKVHHGFVDGVRPHTMPLTLWKSYEQHPSTPRRAHDHVLTNHKSFDLKPTVEATTLGNAFSTLTEDSRKFSRWTEHQRLAINHPYEWATTWENMIDGATNLDNPKEPISLTNHSCSSQERKTSDHDDAITVTTRPCDKFARCQSKLWWYLVNYGLCVNPV